MPANIEVADDGRAAFYGARTPAWHRLGTITTDALTVPDALKVAHLADWQVEKMPLITSAHDGTPMIVEGRYATVRRNPFVEGQSDILGVGLTDDYNCFQNEQVGEWVQTLADVAGEAVCETAGSLQDGRRVFVTLRLPEGLQVRGVDAYDLYLAAASSHDGSMALTTITTPVRVVCANTLAVALGGAQVTHKVRHTASMDARVQEARTTLGLAWKYADAFGTAMDALLDQEMTDREFDTLIAKEFVAVADDAPKATVARAETARDDLRLLFRRADTQDFGRGTRYGALQAITEWAEWVRPSQQTEASASSVLFGAGRDMRQKAFVLLSR